MPDPEPAAATPARRYARLRELGKFALIANLVFCALVVLPLTLAAIYQVQRTGWMGAGPRVWRVLGLNDVAMVVSLLLAAATPPLLLARRRRTRAPAAPPTD
jgi:hypothetical protein